MPKKIHDKVDDLLNSDSFYPEKSEKEREELAWPIATNIVKESSFNLKRFTYAQAEDDQELFKSTTLSDFATKFFNYAKSLNLRLDKAYNEYNKKATYKEKKLSGYKGFKLFQTYLSQNVSKVLTALDLITQLTNIEKNESNFVFDEATSQESNNTQTGTSTTVPSPGRINVDNVVNNLPGPGATGNYGTPGIQGITQFTSQSAARAPKTKEQVEASERMFMMDNNDALRVLSRNILDPVAYKNFQKDVVMSKNHIGTRFEAPVNNLKNLYNDLINASDSKTRNKLGAQIQHIIQNQLLGSKVSPSVVDLKNDPYSKTDYLYSGKKAPTPYIFRYLEDVYKDSAQMKTMTDEFNAARKKFEEEFIKKLTNNNPDTPADRVKPTEDQYPPELQLVAKPGSPIHERAWMEKNKKTELEKLATQPVKDSSLKTTEGEGFKATPGSPNITGEGPAKSGTPAPANDGKTTASQNLQKLKYNNRTTTKS